MNSLLHIKFIALLKLVRFENLLMIAISQYLVRYFLIGKVFNNYELSLGLNDGVFALLVLSTVLIAAAGYIINDYFDVKTDLINHPDTVVVEKVIKRRWAIIMHMLFTAIGLGLGVYCSLMTGYLRLSLFHVFAAVFLWFYSTHFKKQLITGNIIVSLLTASVIMMPLVYEMGLMQKTDPAFTATHQRLLLSAFKVTLIYALFAFITSMAREVIKDMEDYQGDKATGGQTLPIKWGMQSAKLTAIFLIIITYILILFVVYNTFRFQKLFFTWQNAYIFVALLIPLTLLLIFLFRSDSQRNFRQCSILLKFIMLMGLIYSLIFYYL